MKSYFNLPILLYHNILDHGCDITGVSEAQFENQLRLLKQLGYSTCSLFEAYQMYLQRRCEKKVLIQFDDAYKDTIEVAAPILRRFGFVASLFIIVDYIGKTNEWDNRIDRKLMHMDFDDIQRWLSYGFDIGSHTISHHNLKKFSDDELLTELRKSKLVLQDKFNRKVRFLSYPYGAYNEKVKKISELEYDLAFSVGDGVDNWLINRYAIKRFQINRDITIDEVTSLLDCQ